MKPTSPGDGTLTKTSSGTKIDAGMTLSGAFRRILALFFLWGFLTCLNDVLVPHLKFIFGLSYTQAVAVPAVFFSTCFLAAPFCARVTDRLGYKRTLSLALTIMAAGSLCFLPAVGIGQFRYFLGALAVLGGGITLLQVAAAPYVAFLGPAREAPRRFSLALGLNSLGTMLAPLFGSWLILRDAGTVMAGSLEASRRQAMHQIVLPYLFLGLSLVALAATVALSRLPPIREGLGYDPAEAGDWISVLRHRPLLFGAIAAFLYAGAEIGIGSFLINYLELPAVAGLTPRVAALFVSGYWGGATLGRFLGWGILARYKAETVLALSGAGAAVLLTASVFSTGAVAVAAVLLIGLCNAMVVPVVVMLAIAGLGSRTLRASSVMVAANIGGGLVPLAMGALADRVGLRHAYLLPVVCYAFVIYYAVYGSRGHGLQERETGAGF